MTAAYLADKSAVERARVPEIREHLGLLRTARRLHTCPMIDLEILYSARNLHEYEGVLVDRAGLLPARITPEVMARAIDIQHELAKKGQHRCPIPDLVIAATAAEAGLTVLHYDADFELIGKVAGIRHEWIAPRGSVA